jgi:hypothetical protein
MNTFLTYLPHYAPAAALVLCGVYFEFPGNPIEKRRWWPIFNIALAISLLIAAQAIEILSLAVPGVVAFAALQLGTVRFCNTCGRSLLATSMVHRSCRCPHCGGERS